MLVTTMHVEYNEDKEICSACGGRCCAMMPGEYHPHDFLITEDKINWKTIKELLEKGEAQIDWWEGDPRDDVTDEEYKDQSYYLRPTALDYKKDKVFSPTYGGRCIHLSRNGCKLKFWSRPYQCKMLKPTAALKENCESPISKKDIAIAWLSYGEKLEVIGKKVQKEKDKLTE